jgi:hypothetical protein
MFKLIATGVTEEKTAVKASAGKVYSIIVNNQNAAVRYLKLYNQATAPDVSTDVPVMTIAVQATSTVVIEQPNGFDFTTGIAIAMVTGVGDTNAAEISANESVINIGYI